MIAAILGFLRALFADRKAPAGEPQAPVVLPVSSRFHACLAEILRHEGGYVDHPSDPGGATNLGITMATLADWRGRAVSKAEVRALTVAEAGAIYRARYWQPVRGDALPPGVDLAVFDFGVNSGPGRAARALQKVVGTPQDGTVGPVTLAAVGRATPAWIVREICDGRLAFLRGQAAWPTFGRGWTRRVEDVREAALRAANL